MAPESFEGKRVEQTDLWAVTVILYQLLSGQLPFSAENINALLTAIMTQEPKILPSAVPKKLQEFILRGLEKDPTKRFASVAEMKIELQNSLIEEVLNVPPTPSRITEPINPNPQTVANLGYGKPSLGGYNRNPITLGQQSVDVEHGNIKNPEIVLPEIQPLQEERKKAVQGQKYIMVGIIVVLVLVGISYGVYKNIIQKQENIESIEFPAKNETMEILKYWIESTSNVKKVSKREANQIRLTYGQVFKIHIIANESGYIYILGPGEKNLLTTF
ncbi:MAG: serine/threonine protein kinase bacterial [bacterium]|nr:MAG: serine/threonine protein kinase bacterial [bacterium]